MPVTMYDCDFGDCFVIEDEHVDIPLYVDFGVHNRSTVLKTPALETRYDDIIAKMPEKKNLLITHYHEDHYSGLVHMYNKGLKDAFRDVYIPDVWDTTDHYKLIKLIILSSIYNRGTRAKLSLALFLKSICTYRVHLIKRGDYISNHMVALWPDKAKIKKLSAEIALENLPDNVNETLNRLAENLYTDVMQIVSLVEMEGGTEQVVSEAAIQDLDECDRLINDINIEDIPEDLYKSLGDLGNNVSIVFRNLHAPKTGRDMIFTGDVDYNIMEKICKRTDWPRMLNSSIIKIPHHGTGNHYYDFTGYTTSGGYYLIPNGSVNDNSWKIDNRYLSDAAKTYSKVIVSNGLGFLPGTHPIGVVDINASRDIYANI